MVDDLTRMLKSETLTKYNSLAQSSPQPIFILCDTCYWYAIYLDKRRIPKYNTCPKCHVNNLELTSFPIMSNESFTLIIILN